MTSLTPLTPLTPLQLEIYLVSLLAVFALGGFVLPPLTQTGTAVAARAVRARRTLPPAPPECRPRMTTDLLTAEVAAGSLTGTAPSDIRRLAVVTVTDAGRMRLLTSCCPHELPELLTRLQRTVSAGPVDTGGPCRHWRTS